MQFHSRHKIDSNWFVLFDLTGAEKTDVERGILHPHWGGAWEVVIPPQNFFFKLRAEKLNFVHIFITILHIFFEYNLNRVDR